MLVHDASLADERELVSAVARRGGAGARERAARRGAARHARGAAGLARADRRERRRGAAPDRARPARRRAAAARRARADAADSPRARLDARPDAARPSCSTPRRPTSTPRSAELRELARGIHPAVLSDRGLGPALEALAGRVPLPVEIDGDPGRAAPRPGRGGRLLRRRRGDHQRRPVRARRRTPRSRSSRDDGRGRASRSATTASAAPTPTAGSGLRGLADRVAALDGRLEVDSPPGAGTTVRAVIPLPAARRARRRGG